MSDSADSTSVCHRVRSYSAATPLVALRVIPYGPGNYGDRVPGLWFYPNTMRLHLTDGSLTDSGSNEFVSLISGTHISSALDVASHVPGI